MLTLKLQYLGYPDAKNWLTGKDPDAGKDWMPEKGMTENEMAGWHHQLDGQAFEQVLGVDNGQGSPVCMERVGHTERLNWNLPMEEMIYTMKIYDAGVKKNCRWHKPMERYTIFLDWKSQYCQNKYTTQGNLRTECNSCQITNGKFLQI